MFTRKYRQMNVNLQQQLITERLYIVVLDRSVARAEFDPDGNIIDANKNFLTLLGYRRDEVLDKLRYQLCDGAYAQSEDYRHFWEHPRRGEHFSGRCRRITREGRPFWLETIRSPVRDGQGRLFRVIKYVSDIDATVHQEHEMRSKPDALPRSMAMAGLNPNGNALTANDNFPTIMGYSRAKLAGANHRQLCEPGYHDDPQYADLQRRLNRGEYAAGRFRRVHRNGQPVRLEASYNPVYDVNDKPFGVVKFASNVGDHMRRYQAEADNAHQTHTLSAETRIVTEHGALIIQSAMEEMSKIVSTLGISSLNIGELLQHSQQITSTVNTIHEITKQTSLFALNVVIGTIHTGDQGHNFAVVVGEVRQLARRTSKSTKEIADMVDRTQTGTRSVIDDMQHSQEQVWRNVGPANETGTMIPGIHEGTHKVIEAVQQFSHTLNAGL